MSKSIIFCIIFFICLASFIMFSAQSYTVVKTPSFFDFSIKTTDDISLIQKKIFELLEKKKKLYESLPEEDQFDQGQFISYCKDYIIGGERLVYEIEDRLKLLYYFLLESSSQAIQKEIQSVIQEINLYEQENFSFNVKVYNFFRRTLDTSKANPHIFMSSNLSPRLASEIKRILEKTCRSFESSGIQLEEVQKKDLIAVNQKLLELGLLFQGNIRKHVDIFLSEDQLGGLSEDNRKTLDSQKNENGSIRLIQQTLFLLLKEIDREDVRKKLYEELNANMHALNEEAINSMVPLIQKKSALLGYESYAEYDLLEEMAGTPQNARLFLEELISATTLQAEKVKSDFLSFVKKEYPLLYKEEGLDPWNISYCREKYSIEKYTFSQDDIAEYFPCKKTIEKMASFFATLFDVFIDPIVYDDTSVLVSEKNTVLRVTDKSGEVLGDIIFDLHQRENKYPNGCCLSLQLRGEEVGSKQALVLINGVFQERSDNCLLLNDVITLFHEFGHALHFVFSYQPIAAGIATSLQFDFMECPSQLFEQFIFDQKLLSSFSGHYYTGEKLDEARILSILEKKREQAIMFYQGQAWYAFFSLLFYSQKSIFDVSSLFNDLKKKVILFDNKATLDTGYCNFLHISPDKYAAKYYSYLWSLRYAKAIFKHIREADFSSKAGKKLRTLVLERGGSCDGKELCNDFLKKEISCKDLFE
jgi:Zn-dependent oligopeptidase